MLLDADILVDLLRSHPGALAWWGALAPVPPASGVAALEVLFGARDAAELRRTSALLSGIPIARPEPADAVQAEAFAPLHLSHGIGSLDAVTAALALRLGLPLATFNVRHFAAVPGLTTVQPYVR